MFSFEIYFVIILRKNEKTSENFQSDFYFSKHTKWSEGNFL